MSPVLGCCLALALRCRPQPPLLVCLRVCLLRVWCLPLVLPLRLVHPVGMSTLGNLPAQRGAHLFGGRSRSGTKRGEGRSPSPARSARSAHASASSDAVAKASAMPPYPAGCLGAGGSRSRVTAQRLTMTTLLSLGLRDWVRVRGLCRPLTGLAGSMVVGLPPLLRVRWMSAALIPSARSIWIRSIPSRSRSPTSEVL